MTIHAQLLVTRKVQPRRSRYAVWGEDDRRMFLPVDVPKTRRFGNRRRAYRTMCGAWVKRDRAVRPSQFPEVSFNKRCAECTEMLAINDIVDRLAGMA